MTQRTSGSVELLRCVDVNGKTHVVKVVDYERYIDNQDKELIASFIFNRLHSRYLKPYLFVDRVYKEQYKNGFAIMASCCLLIETLQSFRNGWGDSDRKSAQAFRDFFSSDKNFTELKTKGQDFYENVRCGILHQGETCRGWTIDRGSKALIDGKKIHSVTFLRRLEKSLQDYCDQLIMSKWDSEVWDNLRTKMRKVVLNCQ
jgi:hypothetical protein